MAALLVWLAALVLGGTTALGAALGYWFRQAVERFHRPVQGMAAGVMVGAALLGLVLPALEGGLGPTLWGIALGAVAMDGLGRATQRWCCGAGGKAVCFVVAMTLHNLPEGIAAGAGFWTGRGLFIAAGIALQNLPEGMAVMTPLLRLGLRPRRALFWAAATGLAEVAGTVLGYWALGLLAPALPFALAFAGGTMLYLLWEELIPESGGSPYWALGGICLMLVLEGIG